jgi:hypothetical protein
MKDEAAAFRNLAQFQYTIPNITNRETKSLILILKPTLAITILVTLLVVAQSQAMNANVRLVCYFFMAIEMD